MALQDVFLTPLGLAALLVGVPVVVLYLIRPDPSRVELPTYRFLTEKEREGSTTAVFERLSRSLLLVLQLLVILLLAVSLASPYVPVSERETVEETVLVVDTSASMATGADGASRFERAVATAREEVTGTTSVVTTANGGSVVRQRDTPGDTRSSLAGLSVTDAPGDLRDAVAQAGALAGENARVVVLSDFAGDGWTGAVSTLRARGLSVTLRQFDDGGEANVGFIDRRFSGAEVTLSVKNFGNETVTRAVGLGSEQEQVTLGPGGVGTVTLSVPAGGGQAALSSGDDFPTDDTAFVAAPADPTVRVLVLTNDRNRFLTTALNVSDQVEVSVESPPTTVDGRYDVIVYSNLNPDSLLPGNVESGRDILAEGGGVAIQAQSGFPGQYGNLLLIDPTGVSPSPTIRDTRRAEITRGIDFQPPAEAVTGELRSGQALVELRDGSPLVATDERGSGRVIYYGYLEDRSSFKYNYQYPVFWKQAVFYLAGRQPLAALNHQTGDTVRFGAEPVEGPSGSVDGQAADLVSAGFYAAGGDRHSASLLDESESSVGVEPLAERSGAAGATTREETRTVPRPLTEFFAIAGLVAALLEVGYLRQRGDL